MGVECKIQRAVEIRSLFSAFEERFTSNYCFDGESHDFWEIVCVMSGKVGVTADNDVYSLDEDSVIFHKPMEFHRIRSDGGTSPRVIIFSFSADSMCQPEKRVFRMSSSNKEMLEEIFREKSKIFCKNPDNCSLSVIKGMELEARLFVKRLEVFIMSVLLNDTAEDFHEITRGAESYRRVVNMLKSNLDKNMSVNDISALCNMSPSNVKRVFTKYSGIGVIGYFNHLKVEKAKALLKEGLSIKEVSAMLGFESQNYFSTVFKRIDGISPAKYKTKG